MKILMVGGTGVLSTAVTNIALDRNFNITLINRGIIKKNIEGVRLIKSDKEDYNNIESQISGEMFDCVIDFLCYTFDEAKKSYDFYSRFSHQYVFISSCAVYDKTVSGIKTEESPKPLNIWAYSVNKWDCEQRLMRLAADNPCCLTIVRPCVTYGDTRIPYGISPTYRYHWTLAARILAGKPIIRWNGGTNRCNMMRVEDFAVGLIGLIGNPTSYGEAYNICGDETPSFNDVLVAMADYLGKKPVLFDLTSEEYAQEIPNRRGELLGGRSMDAINSNDKIKSVVPSFCQKIFLKEGVRMTLDAYKRQNYQKGIDWAFDADTDRIIAKFCKKKGIPTKQYNLRFVDYLGSATPADKKLYWRTFHKEDFRMKVYNKLSYLKSVIISKLMKK